MTHLIILDRDGVIGDQGAGSAQPTHDGGATWRPLPGSLEAIAKLNRAGYTVVVAINHPEARQRNYDVEVLHTLHDHINRQLAALGGHVDAFFYCPCLPRDNCDCFKPAPGMLLEIAARLRVDLSDVPVVGDALCDLKAAHAAGAIPVLVLTGQGTDTAAGPDLPERLKIFPDLASAADAFIAQRAKAAAASGQEAGRTHR